MKRLLSLVVLISTPFISFSQTPNYQALSSTDLGVLFSQDDNYGTARFEAISGAFGALGGDISSFGINPAGSAIALSSSASFSLSNKNLNYTSQYYGSSSSTLNNSFNFSQAGSILIFKTNSEEWKRVALTVNYRIKSDYSSFYRAEGNSGFLYYKEHLDDIETPKNQFEESIEQTFSPRKSGRSSVTNFGLSTVYFNKLYMGTSLNFHDLNFKRFSYLEETNNDGNGNTLNSQKSIDSFIQGNGFSLSLGFIYKFDQNFRLGIAYETPTWYSEIIEDFLTKFEQDPLKNDANNLDFGSVRNTNEQGYIFGFRSNSRITLSGAYIFNKKGFISFDYSYKDYKNLKFSDEGPNFMDTNQSFASNYRNTHSFNIGTEWRFDKFSLRGGYHYAKNPNLLTALGGSINEDNARGFSTGFGYNFGHFTIDLSYSKFKNKEFESIYNLGDISLDNNTTRITGTLTLNL